MKTIFSGVQPSGNLHVGNYFGAIKQWVEMQNDYQCLFCVVDYHAITVKQDPEVLRRKIIETAKIYLASGIDPERSIIFQQSDVKEHTELAWILNCVSARMADLKKMTQFKDKAGEGQDNVSVGLFAYPVLMAADILLYNTDVVPVGDDQVQHVELCRDLGKRFNNLYGEVFKIPEVKIKKESARIMGLDDPQKKMSKSATSEWNYLGLTDEIEKAKKKIMKAVTDSGSEIIYDKANKPALANLLTIYSLASDRSIKDLEKEFIGKGYGDFKKGLAETMATFLISFQEKYSKIKDNDVKEILYSGAEKARIIAQNKIEEVRKKIGVLS
ncbi:MAG: tryptophan--tRNA ligase [Planctomycetes bacterium]|nr:tryptophan--tRNA ligase [Planctomycetota bacterium]